MAAYPGKDEYMRLETKVILKAILYNVEKSKTLSEAKRAVRVLCDKETISDVQRELEEEMREQQQNNENRGE